MTSSSSASVQELVPPINFSLVCPGVYRSGYPTKKNYPFLRALRLRSVLYLCPEEYAETNLKFCEENGITVLRFPTEGNKEPFTDISEPLMHRILSALADTRHHPILVHCNKGKHRTGTVCGCLRLLQGWSLVSIFREYRAFSGNKARVSDQTYMELYYPIVKITPPHVARWLSVSQRAKLVFSDRELEEEEAAQIGASLLAPMPKPEKASKKSKQQQQPQQQEADGKAPPNPSSTTVVGAAQPSSNAPSSPPTLPAAAATNAPSPAPALTAATTVSPNTATTAAIGAAAASPSSAPSSSQEALLSPAARGAGGGAAAVPLSVLSAKSAAGAAAGSHSHASSDPQKRGMGGNPLTSPAAAAAGVEEHKRATNGPPASVGRKVKP